MTKIKGCFQIHLIKRSELVTVQNAASLYGFHTEHISEIPDTLGKSPVRRYTDAPLSLKQETSLVENTPQKTPETLCPTAHNVLNGANNHVGLNLDPSSVKSHMRQQPQPRPLLQPHKIDLKQRIQLKHSELLTHKKIYIINVCGLSHYISSNVAMQQQISNTKVKYVFCCNGRFIKCAELNACGGQGANHTSAVRDSDFSEITKGVH